MHRLLRFALPLIFLSAQCAGLAGPLENGIPFVRNFRPRDYRADAQNWAVIQDARGLVYAGNNTGVLEFDGARWRLIPTTRHGVVRSLAAGADGRIYVGAVGEFGVLAADPSGRFRFTPLNGGQQACPEFADVWVTAATPKGILFQSPEALFLLEDGQIRVIKASTTFHTAFVVDGRVFVRQREVGLQELKGDQLERVPGGELFKHESIFAMASLEGPGGPGGILVGSRNLGLFRLAGGRLQPFVTGADRYLKDNVLYNAARLPDGSLALATLRGGVLFMAADGRPLGVLNHALGLLGDNVKQVAAGQGPSVWLALDTGLAQVEWPSAFSTFDERQGLKGQVWDLARQGGTLYVATGQGVFRLAQEPAPLPHPVFRPIQGISTQCYCLLAVDGDLLLASGQGVFSIRGDQAIPVRPSSNAAITLFRSRRDPDRVFVGLQGQTVSLRRQGGVWRDEGPIPGLTEDVYSMVEAADGSLWLGTGSDQVVRLRFPAPWPGTAPQIDRFGPAQGLTGANGPSVCSVAGTLAVATQEGIFAFQADSGRFVPHPQLSNLFPDGPRWVHAITADDRGRYWMTTSDQARGLEASGFAQLDPAGPRWNPGPFQRLGENATQVIHPEPDGTVWFGGAGGLHRWDGAAGSGREHPFLAVIRQLTQGQDRVIYGGDGPPRLPPRLGFSRGGLRFEFSAPSPGPEGSVAYQVYLAGFDRDWSAWSPEPQKEYVGLPAGRYRFQVRARNAQGEISAPASFEFLVSAPLHRTWWAFLVYAGALAGAVLLLLRARTRMLRQRNAFLHARIEEATWDLRENEQLLARMNLELRALNDQKDQFLGIVVHDLSNPLNGILLNTEMILEQHGPGGETERRAQAVLKAGEAMKELIKRFLDISAIDAGRIKAELGPLDVEELFLDTWLRFFEPAKGKDITIERILAQPGLRVLADRRFLGETLDNLVSNAVKFSPAGTRITLRAASAGGRIRLSVEDQGPGLTGDDLSRLFGRFTKLSARPTGGESSAGLGLSIVKYFVEAMGGRIWAESEPGQGAAFRVELPGG
jgi:signal transduction histidine kinase